MLYVLVIMIRDLSIHLTHILQSKVLLQNWFHTNESCVELNLIKQLLVFAASADRHMDKVDQRQQLLEIV